MFKRLNALGFRGRFIALALLMLLAAYAGWSLQNWLFQRPPVKIALSLVVEGTQFRTTEAARNLFEKMRAGSLSIRGFSKVRFDLSQVEIADSKLYDLERDVFPERAWKPVAIREELVLKPIDSTALVTIRPVTRSESLILDALSLHGPASILLKVPERNNLSIGILGLQESGTVQLPAEFLITSAFCYSDGTPWPYTGESVSFRVRNKGARFMQFSADSSGMVFDVNLLRNGVSMTRDGVSIDEVRFVDQDSDGKPITTLVKGELQIVEPPKMSPIQWQRRTWLRLGGLRDFKVEGVLAENADSFDLILSGKVGEVLSGDFKPDIDHRLTNLERLVGNRYAAPLSSVLGFLGFLPTVFGFIPLLLKKCLLWLRGTKEGGSNPHPC